MSAWLNWDHPRFEMEIQAAIQPQLNLGGVLLAAAPFVLQPDPAEMAQTTGTASTELEHQDCTRISWDQRSWGKETCNKHRAFIQALG